MGVEVPGAPGWWTPFGAPLRVVALSAHNMLCNAWPLARSNTHRFHPCHLCGAPDMWRLVVCPVVRLFAARFRAAEAAFESDSGMA